jgi:hypothetical protein
MRLPMKTPLILLLMTFPLLTMADTMEFEAADFSLNPTFSDVQTFHFSIVIATPLMPGESYTNPELSEVVYTVSGSLDDTPSGFPSFGLARTIAGAEFYNQGSSLEFEIDASADLSDGLQVSELVGDGLVFLLNAREVDTGRYHPPWFELKSDGTGIIQNSNNQGGVNPGSGEVVNVDFGDEYITEMSFDPASVTLLAPPELIHEDGFE